MSWSQFYIGNPLFNAGGEEIGYTKYNQVQYPGTPTALYDTNHKLLGRYQSSSEAVKVLATRKGISATSVQQLAVGGAKRPAISNDEWKYMGHQEERDRQTILATSKAVGRAQKAHRQANLSALKSPPKSKKGGRQSKPLTQESLNKGRR